MKILKEPLLRFLAIGALLFVLFELAGNQNREPVDEIVITPGRIQSLAGAFAKTMQRPPSPAELNGMIEEFVQEEIFYREALALGLDRDDPIVRRRMRQKLEFLAENVADLQQPSDAELQEYLEEHVEYFRQEAVVSFQHVFLNPESRGEQVEHDGEVVLKKLQSETVMSDAELGDRFMLGYVFREAPDSKVKELFGDAFAKRLSQLPAGEWSGPVVSDYGLHLVKVEVYQPSRLPQLEEVRDVVLREWTSGKRMQMNQAVYEEIRDRYKVTVEWDESVASKVNQAQGI